MGDRSSYFSADVTKISQCRNLVKHTIKTFGNNYLSDNWNWISNITSSKKSSRFDVAQIHRASFQKLYGRDNESRFCFI